jgi:hypothetical protein
MVLLWGFPLAPRALECVDGHGREASIMKQEYEPGNHELPCDTMIVEENSESRIISEAWLYFSPRLGNKDRKIIVKGSLFVQGILGAVDNMGGNGIGGPGLSWSGIRIEPCGEAEFGSATVANSEMPLEIRSRYVRLGEVRFPNARSILLPDSSVQTFAPVQSEYSSDKEIIVTNFASENLAYFQGGKGRCKDLEKRIAARGSPSQTAAKTAKEGSEAESFWISVFYWEAIAVSSVLILGAFVYFR